jgi:hypothetical protein
MQFINLSSPNQSIFSLLFTFIVHVQKSLNWKPKIRNPHWGFLSDSVSRSLNLFLSANNQPPSTSTTALASRPSSFLFFHHRQPTSSISAATVRTRAHTITTTSLQSSPVFTTATGSFSLFVGASFSSARGAFFPGPFLTLM